MGPMVVTPQAEQVWELTAEGKDGQNPAQLIINRFRYRLRKNNDAEPFGDDIKATVIQRFRVRWEGIMADVLSQGYTLVRYHLRCITDVVQTPGPPVHYEADYGNHTQFTPAALTGGGRVGLANPSFVAVPAKWQPAIVSRYTRSSSRFGPCSDSDIDGPSFTAGYRATYVPALATMLNSLQDEVGNAFWSPGVFSPKLAWALRPWPTYAAAGTCFFPWLTAAFPDRVTTQITRKVRAGLQ